VSKAFLGQPAHDLSSAEASNGAFTIREKPETAVLDTDAIPT
jgi:hypothetical protein